MKDQKRHEPIISLSRTSPVSHLYEKDPLHWMKIMHRSALAPKPLDSKVNNKSGLFVKDFPCPLHREKAFFLPQFPKFTVPRSLEACNFGVFSVTILVPAGVPEVPATRVSPAQARGRVLHRATLTADTSHLPLRWADSTLKISMISSESQKSGSLCVYTAGRT